MEFLTQDVMQIKTLPQGMFYMVADGHLGINAAAFVEQHFYRLLHPLIPLELPDFENRRDLEAYAEILREAICDTFVHIENEWMSMGHIAGSTVSIILITGRLITSANIGDSAAVIDTGCSFLELTDSHRIHDHVTEKERLLAAGCTLAQLGFHLEGPARPKEPGVGPLRIWPGGLCVSRSIGDIRAGPEIVPLPHIKQVLIPEQGCRVIMASDGLWDNLSLSKAVKIARPKPTESAASTLSNSVLRGLRLNDDTSVIVIDALPAPTSNFPTIALQMALHPEILQRRKPKKGGLCACIQTENDEPDSQETHRTGPGHLPLLSDIDSLKVYPHLLHNLVHKSHLVAKGDDGATKLGLATDTGLVRDYTMHGAAFLFGPRKAGSSAAAVVNPGEITSGGGGLNGSSCGGPSIMNSMQTASCLIPTPPGSEQDPESTMNSESRSLDAGSFMQLHHSRQAGSFSPVLQVTRESASEQPLPDQRTRKGELMVSKIKPP